MISKFLCTFIEGFLRPLDGGLGEKLRYYYYRRRFKVCGGNVRIGTNVKFSGTELISVGSNVWIDDGCILIAGFPENFGNRELRQKSNVDYGQPDGQLRIGSYVHLGPGCILNSYGGGIDIGDHCGLSSGVKAYSMSNHYRSFADPNQITYSNPMTKEHTVVLQIYPIKLGKNCFITLNAILLGGFIDDNCYVAPQSVVRGCFERNSIISGSPAKVKGVRYWPHE